MNFIQALLKLEIRRQINQMEGAFSGKYKLKLKIKDLFLEIINKVKNLRIDEEETENNNSPASSPKSNSTISTPVDVKEIQLTEKGDFWSTLYSFKIVTV